MEIYMHHFHLHNYGDHNELTFHIRLPDNMTIKEAKEKIKKMGEAASQAGIGGAKATANTSRDPAVAGERRLCHYDGLTATNRGKFYESINMCSGYFCGHDTNKCFDGG